MGEKKKGDVILNVSHLKKYFSSGQTFFGMKRNPVQAVDDISFTIRRGEIFGLVGESGCGKSTAGRTILNLLEPTGGRVEFDGTELYDVEAGRKISGAEMGKLRKDMQIVFQDPNSSLDPRMNIAGIMTEGMKRHHIGQTDAERLEKAGEILELCGIEKSALAKYPHQFSGGQRQRIGIARALALNPKFMIGDELIASLDVSIKAQIINLLMDLIRQFGLTFLFISHDLATVRYFCDRVGVMYLGSFMEEADASELFTMPVHPYTRALLSAVPPAEPEEKKDRIILKGEVPTAANPPSGCRFHTRCPYAKEICRTERPCSTEVAEGHLVTCHFAKEFAAKLESQNSKTE